MCYKNISCNYSHDSDQNVRIFSCGRNKKVCCYIFKYLGIAYQEESWCVPKFKANKTTYNSVFHCFFVRFHFLSFAFRSSFFSKNILLCFSQDKFVGHNFLSVCVSELLSSSFWKLICDGLGFQMDNCVVLLPQSSLCFLSNGDASFISVPLEVIGLSSPCLCLSLSLSLSLYVSLSLLFIFHQQIYFC